MTFNNAYERIKKQGFIKQEGTSFEEFLHRDINKSFAQVWEELADIPFDEVDGELFLAEDWYFFTKGTSREDVWHGLEDLNGVAIGDLL